MPVDLLELQHVLERALDALDDAQTALVEDDLATAKAICHALLAQLELVLDDD